MDRSAIKQFSGCFATDVKPQIVFDAPDEPMLRAAFGKAAASKGVKFAAATMCLYDDEFLFINGEAFVIKGDAVFWRTLADERHTLVSAKQSSETIDALYAWYCDGWLCLTQAA
jgi:50S ribosomal protein L16 3-hydroxylase